MYARGSDRAPQPGAAQAPNPQKLAEAKRLLAEGLGILKVAKRVRLGTRTVQRLKREPAVAMAYPVVKNGF